MAFSFIDIDHLKTPPTPALVPWQREDHHPRRGIRMTRESPPGLRIRLAPRVVGVAPWPSAHRVPFSSTQPGLALAIGWSPTERRGDEKKPLEQTPVEPNLFVKVAPHAGSESDLAVLSALGSTPQQCSHFSAAWTSLSTPFNHFMIEGQRCVHVAFSSGCKTFRPRFVRGFSLEGSTSMMISARGSSLSRPQ